MRVIEQPLDLDRPIKAGSIIVAYAFNPRMCKGKVRKRRTGLAYLVKVNADIGAEMQADVSTRSVSTKDVRDCEWLAPSVLSLGIGNVFKETCIRRGLQHNVKDFFCENFQFFKLKIVPDDSVDQRVMLVFDEKGD